MSEFLINDIIFTFHYLYLRKSELEYKYCPFIHNITFHMLNMQGRRSNGIYGMLIHKWFCMNKFITVSIYKSLFQISGYVSGTFLILFWNINSFQLLKVICVHFSYNFNYWIHEFISSEKVFIFFCIHITKGGERAKYIIRYSSFTSKFFSEYQIHMKYI